MRKRVSTIVLIALLVNPGTGFASPTIPGFYSKVTPPATNTLPQVSTTYGGVTVVTDSSTNTLTVNQNQGQANVVIDWSSFNIGSSATVRFNQGTGTPGTASWKANTSYAVLNRIYSSNASLIYGKLLADGKVFLINQNGILFGAGSQVNVHTLFASSLAITIDNFKKNTLTFKADTDTTGSTPGAVSNSGTITTDDAGSVYLIAPNVENYGTIDARYGQIGLIAGNEVSIAASKNAANNTGSTEWALVPTVTPASAGTAVNRSTGRLNADSGMIGMYGATVQQDGVIRAVTAIKRNGEIQLLARDRIVTGAGSSTSSPISDSTETVAVDTSDTTATFTRGKIMLAGLTGADSSAKRIESYGAISAPSGTVTLNASERVYLDSASSIDVSGVWVDKQAADADVSTQLTSVILRDSYDQKNGTLQGSTITVSSVSGSSIGDISGAITTRQMTAQDRSTTGGSINISVSGGDVIAKEGSVLNFSGGGTRYADGTTSVSKLLCGNTVYDISTAPETLAYSRILGSYTQTSGKFGTVGKWTGLYLGGGTALKDYTQGYTQGSDAGALTVSAGSLVLNSSIDGGVTRGVYQTLTSEKVDAYGRDQTSGLQEPTAGTLTIGVSHTAGSDSDITANAVTRQVVVTADTTSLSSSFDPETTAVDATKTTVLSSQVINAANLSKLSINANTSVTIAKDASIVLAAGGSFSATARRIENDGSITVPSGSVTLTAADNATTYSDNADKEFDASYTSKVYLATGSSISVAGEEVDNLAGKLDGKAVEAAHVTGGTITIEDATSSDEDGTTITGRGVVVNKGAVLDVSGGYTIDTGGKLTGGNAGTLALQGASLILNGDLRGFSLPGKTGGAIALAADNIEVVTQTPALTTQDFTATTAIPAMTVNGTGSVSDYLVISGNRFDDTGFAKITLTSRNDLTVDNGVTITPSLKKLPVPVSGSSGGSSLVAANYYATVNGQVGSDGTVTLDDVGASSVSLLAGQKLAGDSNTRVAKNENATVTVDANSTIKVAPGSSSTITVDGPAVTIGGTLDAPAGTINVTAENHDLTVDSSARISAAGYDKPDATVVATGITAGYNPLDAGTVNLTATLGNLVLEERSVVDVSGSAPVTVASANGTAVPTTAVVASTPGTVNISYLGTFTNAGTLKAKRYQDNLSGGTLTVNSKGITEGIEVSGDLISGYLASGFDSLTFQSSKAVNLSGSMDLSIGRSLTLDAPMITGSGSDTVKLSSPWITIKNSASGQSAATASTDGLTATLELDGKWLDLEGDVVLNGFATAGLTATRDIRLADAHYSVSGTSYWSGRLATEGDLTLTADRIYPKMTETTFTDSNGVTQIKSMQSDYSIDVGGKLTTMPSSDPTSGQPVYSAGGSVTITADGGFEHYGTILAPMGTISIDTGTSRVFLGEGSVLSTAGSTNVAYGYLDENSAMRTDDKTDSQNTSGTAVSEAPQKSITINGDTVIVKQGATIDISGGGSVTAYSFQAGTQGSANPYTANGAMVIVAGNRYDLPGKAVYLSGGNGLAAGVYTILDASYAYLPGAYVITDLGTTKTGGTYQTTTGATVVSGYATVAGTSISSNQLHYYSVRAASDLRQEGNFTTVSLSGNDAGSLTINANTAVLNGTINVSAPAGSNGGSLTFGGTNLTVQTDVATLADSFGFDSALSADLENTFQVKSGYLTNKGLREISFGTDDTIKDGKITKTGTTSITVAKGSTLEAAEINLITSSSDTGSTITIGEGATIRADKSQVIGTDGSTSYSGGSVTISSGGAVSIGSSAEVYAGSDLNLQANTLSLGGSLKGNASTLNVSSGANNLILGTDSSTKGLALGDGFFSALSGFTSMSLTSGKDIRIVTDFSLTVGDTLRLDAARIVADASQPITANFNATKFELINTSVTADTATAVGTGGGTLSFNADSGTIGNGSIGISGFDTTSFTATNSLAFLGKGSLSLDRGNLDITAAKITAGPAYLATTGAYQAASFVVSSGTGALALIGTGRSSSDSDNYLGGSLSFAGSKITSSATIELTAGQVSLTATGNGGVTLESDAKILARGYDYAASDGTVEHEAGGTVTLRADSGPVTVASGAVIDVSAPGAGDAGSVKLISAKNGVTLQGTIKGNSTQGGQGGSFSIDSLTLDGVGGLDGLSTLLADAGGGFNNLIDIHSHSGDLTLAGNKTLTGREVTVTADNGNLTLDGTIDASGVSGGRVELNAGHNLNVNGAINAAGTTGAGGDVLLNVAAYDDTSKDGTLTFAGTINVSSESSTGGTVAFRAPQTADYTDVKMNLNGGTVAGASLITAEAVKVHHYDGDVNINSALQTTLANDVTYFLAGVDNSGAVNKDATASAANIASVTDRLSGELGSKLSLLSGIELQSTGSITLTADWDLTSWRTASGAPGVLTLRAAGDLTINYKLVDHPNSYTSLPSLDLAGSRTSWGLNLTAGSNLASSDLLTVNKQGTGTLTINGGNTSALVYTESGPIQFASGGDTVLGTSTKPSYMINSDLAYTLASYSGSIRGETGGSLTVNGAIETATGDVTLEVGSDLNLPTLSSAIRTTGISSNRTNYWDYADGGDIDLDVGGSVSGLINSSAWDTVTSKRLSSGGNAYYWSAKYTGTPTTGLATMGGGSLSVKSGGDFNSQAGTFGKSGTGNLTILSGGDLTGRFNVSNGDGVIHAAGNITTTGNGKEAVIGTYKLGSLSVVAQGGITLGTVYDVNIGGSSNIWDPSYSADSRLYVNAVNGDLEITGTNPYVSDTNLAWRNAILPASVFLFAGNDILLENKIYLAPSLSGNLQIEAGGNINGSYGSNEKALIVMSDADSSSFYDSTSIGSLSESVLFGVSSHGNTSTQRDSTAITITAGQDLEDIKLYAPKEANLSAGRDIRDIYYVGQNLNSTDVSSVSAGRDITFSSVVGGSTTDVTGLEQDGPGALLVQAGRNIDLGTSAGITTKGNAYNSALDSTKGSDLYVVAGVDSLVTTDSVKKFFEGDSDNNINGLQEYGIEYSELKAAGDTAGAQQRLDEARTLLINTFFGGQTDTGTGTINMTSSKISTLFAKDNIYMMARGEINVGKTSLILDKTIAAEKQANTGIYTAKGGAINIFSGGDLNVNESRVMSFQGGDLTLWSDHGNVNAGRGSKTQISSSSPTLNPHYDSNGNIDYYEYVFSPPSVGSGIRTLTYSSKLGEAAPEAGNIYAFAPEGAIDAGEAGIAGNKVVLGATEFLNPQNITAGAGSVGVPSSSGSTVSIGSFSGSSGLADSSRMIEQTSGAGAARDALKSTTQVLDDFMSKFLDVKVISFDSDPGDDGNVKDKDKDKK